MATCGFAHAYDAGDVFGAASALAFLGAADEQWAHAEAAACVEGGDAFGAVKFVGGETHRVDIRGLHVDGDFADGLRAIDVEWDAEVSAEFGDLCDWEDYAGLIVGPENGDQGGFFVEGGDEGIDIQSAFVIDGNLRDLRAFAGELLAELAGGGMLGGAGDDAFARSAGGEYAADGGVDGFGAGAGECDVRVAAS